MYDELVKRLREATGWKNASEHYSLMKEAADAIETLTGTVKYLMARCDMADKTCSEAVRLGALWKEAALDQIPRWIPVTEEPPRKVGDEGYRGYLIFANGYYEVADYTVDKVDNVPYFHVDGEYEPGHR